MALSMCPKCHSKVAPTDTTCMDCGNDLLAAKVDIVEQAKREARGGPAGPASGAAAVANPAAAGMVLPGENADDKRLRSFDRQEADKLRKQRPAQIVLIGIAAVAAIAVGALIPSLLKKATAAGGLGSLSVAEFKQMGANVTSDPRVMAICAIGIALAGLLCIVGEIRRLMATNDAIMLVDAGETPNIVHLSIYTQIGLLIAAFFLPPFGLLCGIMFKFSKDSDTRSIGSLMIYASLLAIAIILMNWIWELSSRFKTAQPAKVKDIEGAWRLTSRA